MSEEDIFNKFLDLNPNKGVKYENALVIPKECIKGGKFPRIRCIVPLWITNKYNGGYISSNHLSILLNKLGFNIQIYYDVVVLGLTSIYDRPKCPATGKFCNFINVRNGYSKYHGRDGFIKSMSMSDLPDTILRNKRISKSKTGVSIGVGRKMSDEAKKNMSLAQKGHPVSDEARRNMSLDHKGKPGTRTGIKHSDETRELMSKKAIDRIERDPEWLNKFIESGYKKTHKSYYRSVKYNNGSEFYCMSDFEVEFLKFCDESYEVSYIDKCLLIKYEFNGRSKRYIPDVLVHLINGISIIVELKPKYRLNDNIVKTKISYALDYCEKNNLVYSIITEDEIKLIKEKNFILSEYIKNKSKYWSSETR